MTFEEALRLSLVLVAVALVVSSIIVSGGRLHVHVNVSVCRVVVAAFACLQRRGAVCP